MADFQIIGLFGPARSGKDLVADWFVDHGFAKIAYADPMKRFCRKVFGISAEQLWGASEERNKVFAVDDIWWFHALRKLSEGAAEIVDRVLKENVVQGYIQLVDWMQWLRAEYPTMISARVILQTMGTEWGRNIDPHLWTNYAHEVVTGISRGTLNYTQQGGWRVKDIGGPPLAGAVIPDHRFLNEIKLAKERGVFLIRLRRLAVEKQNETVGLAGHSSETENKTIPDDNFDMVLELEEGAEKVYEKLGELYEKAPWTYHSKTSSSL